MSDGNPLSRGDFVLDRTMGGEMRFSITFFNLDHVGRIELFSPEGHDVNQDRKLEMEDGDVNMIFITVQNAMVRIVNLSYFTFNFYYIWRVLFI